MIKMTYDLHTHSTFSDGKSAMEENIVSAIQKGLTAIGLTDHAYGHWAYGVKRNVLDRYLNVAKKLKKAYSGDIEVLVGMEFDLLDLRGNIDLPDGYEKEFDIRLLGMHKATRYSDFLSGWVLLAAPRRAKMVMEAATRAFIAAIEKHRIDVLVHPNYIAPLDMGRIAAVCAARGTRLEINARHWDLDSAAVAAAAQTDVAFVLGSDAHRADEVGEHGYAERFVAQNALPAGRILNAAEV